VIRRLHTRDLVNLIPKFLFAASLSQIYFSYQSPKFVISFILLTFAAQLFQTILEAQLAISLSFISTAAFLQIPFINLLFVGKPAWHVAVAVLAIFILTASLFRLVVKKHDEGHFLVEIAPAIAMFIISFYWSSSRNLGGLNFLGKSEDNAAWLMGLSFGLSDAGGIHYVHDMKWGGGPVFGVFNGWIVGLKSLGLSREYSSFDNVGSLLSAFGLLLMLTVGMFISAVLRFTRRIQASWESLVPLAVASFVVIYVSFASVMRLGHYSFMVAIWLTVCAIAVSEVGFEAHSNPDGYKKIDKIKPIFISALMVASAQSWPAITPVAAVICVLFIAKFALTFYHQGLTKINYLVIGGSIVVVVLVIEKTLGRNIKNGLNVRNLETYFSLDGVAATVSPLLLTGAVVIPLVGYFLSQHSDKQIEIQHSLLIPACTGLIFGLMMLIALPTVHGLNYVIQKFEFLFFLTLVPYCLYVIAEIGRSTTHKLNTALLVGALLITLMYDQSINKGFSYPGVGRSERTIWAKAAESELLNHPERRVVCLNTKDPDTIYSDYVAYSCNRILVGIQGLEDNDDYADWIRLGMWLTDTSRLRSLPDSYYENMTFIVFDPTFSRTGDDVFMSALNGIPWQLVRTVDLNGNQFNKN
jgi:hypothetical protein